MKKYQVLVSANAIIEVIAETKDKAYSKALEEVYKKYPEFKNSRKDNEFIIGDYFIEDEKEVEEEQLTLDI